MGTISGLKSTFITCMICALAVNKTKTHFQMKSPHIRQTTYFISMVNLTIWLITYFGFNKFFGAVAGDWIVLKGSANYLVNLVFNN